MWPVLNFPKFTWIQECFFDSYFFSKADVYCTLTMTRW